MKRELMKSCPSCAAGTPRSQAGTGPEVRDRLVALAGNPNTGKSTLFNALTGLKQHTGNWPGKTVSLCEGEFKLDGVRYRVVDLPGVYSLLPVSPDEQVTRDFLSCGEPDCTVVVLDATILERNLNLALQVLEITHRAVICVNLLDEASRKGVEISLTSLARDLGVPVVGTVARSGKGLHEFRQAVAAVSEGRIPTSPFRPCSACPTDCHERKVENLYREAERIARRAIDRVSIGRQDWERRIDAVVTSPVFGLPLMMALLAAIFWITVAGANYPSSWLASALFWLEAQASSVFNDWGVPWWITGFAWHGVYRGLAWVVSVMLPPMAIFFPMFTILEDLGYLPRVAFNFDWLFRKAGAHGKQALTMAMGFGCNAAGVVSARVIDSPRERLIAILTNTFVPCNGRFPTLIVLSTIFVAPAFSPVVASLAAAGTVVGIVIVGVVFTLLVSWLLSRTLLKGEPSVFTLELPPYRRPNVARILYTSLIDRTLFVLMRAMMTAAPAGGLIWILANLPAGESNVAGQLAALLHPLGRALGMDGVILLAYVIAIPANEIVVPTMLMVYMGSTTLTEIPSLAMLESVLTGQQGWTFLTALNMMLFSLLHNPCATTLLTIWKETGTARWALAGALIPLALAFLVTFLIATVAGVIT